MRQFVFIFLGVWFFVSLSVTAANAQTDPPKESTSSRITAPPDPRMIDGVAARIEEDIITESEVRELSAFQMLVEGQSKPREEVIRELIDQWIVNGEANVAQFKSPSADEVNHAFQQLASRFSSSEEFRKRCVQSDLTEADVRRLITKQVYLSHFLDYRFRPAAQINQKQIEAYYNNELVPKLKAQDQPIPALEDVEDAIQEVLVQRTISERSAEWLNETRARLKIDMMASGDQP